ncbi:unnamed protein product [Adineta ricciae]|uniref:G-protein coupled receptors family 1 profile domain-containing protein n=1 Tax=Adineta ricciae TaxID=249248 RepID=A0A815CNH9_ADIRI|nr:unnamed protein product [Adineta ricciae]CAF1357681.1 unnamed protein product [Adineta ricciae]
MSNSTNTASDSLVVAYYPFTLVIVGTSLNILTFVVLCRSTFRDTKKQPIIHYMRTIAIFDILMLYGWNLDHYLQAVHGYVLLTYTIATCKIFGFLNYFAGQSSAWLRVFICLDRYLSISRLHRTWFSREKSVLIIIASVITILTLFNSHFLIFTCYYRPSGRISPNSPLYIIYPLWDYVNLGVYNFAPFILMVTLNSGVIHHLYRRHQTQLIQNSRINHRAISITLVITTCLFLIMTVPATIASAFSDIPPPISVKILDPVLYTYHILSFPLYFLTFKEFRQECIMMFGCSKNQHRVRPTLTATHTGAGITK